MREILFKAKRLDNGEWVEGSLLQTTAVSLKYFIVQSACYTFGKLDWIEITEVDSETICQYTGLTDKNGNKIWENDIVKCYSFDCSGREVEFISDVFWDDCSWLLHEEEHCDGMLFYFDKNIKFESHVSEIEVIGNIFDNAELLEG